MKALQSKTARRRLEPQSKPYWGQLTVGRFLGYRKRKGKGAGSWVARVKLVSQRRYAEQKLGIADDDVENDGIHVLSFEEAAEAAHEWCRVQESGRVANTKYTVAKCMEDYVSYLRSEGKPSAPIVDGARRRYVESHRLGGRVVCDLTTRELREWRAWVARQPRFHRNGGKKQVVSEEDKRRRKATANRITSQLKAALNLAYVEGLVPSRDAWQRVKPFKGVEAVRVWFLSRGEIPRFIEGCRPGFKELAKGALFTGCRFGELVSLKVEDFKSDSRAIFVERSKSRKARYVYLGDEGVEFFESFVHGRKLKEPMFLKSNGLPWNKGDQRRPFREAMKSAGMDGGTFHGLRHTFASQLIMAGVSSHVVAALLGHTSTRMVEKHYGHLAPNHVKLIARELMPNFGLEGQGRAPDLSGES